MPKTTKSANKNQNTNLLGERVTVLGVCPPHLCKRRRVWVAPTVFGAMLRQSENTEQQDQKWRYHHLVQKKNFAAQKKKCEHKR
jgi:hypothetical protein